jgi:HlyD family secretion protein
MSVPQRYRALFVVVAIVVALAIAFVVARAVLGARAADVIHGSGTIEAVETDVAPKVQGRLAAIRVQDGERVRRGQVVAVLEQADPQLNLEQARATVDAAQAQVGVAATAYDLQRESFETTLGQAGEDVSIARARVGQAAETLGMERRTATLDVDDARSQLAASQSAFDHAAVDLKRETSLYSSGDVARQTVDDATDASNAATARLQAAHDQLATAQADLRTIQVRRYDVEASSEQQGQSMEALQNAEAQRRLIVQRQDQIAAARAQLAQARAQLGLAQDQVRETRLLAPFDGYAISHNFEVGDLVQPGAAVMTVGDLAHPYAYVYVSESDLPIVKTGMRADASIDGLPGRTFAGTVTEINDTAEFTPENVQTQEERIEYLVFRVKIQFTDTTGSLKPGLPIDVDIRVTP